MNTHLGHVQINIDAANLGFYADLLGFLGWNQVMANEFMAGYGSGGTSLWFVGAANGARNDYDGAGANHIAIAAESVADVDAAAAYLAEKGIEALFETPRHRPDFGMGEGQTYYQVMFASPDNLLFEVVYTGPFSG